MRKRDDLRVIITNRNGIKVLDIIERTKLPDMVTGWVMYDNVPVMDISFIVYSNADDSSYAMIPPGDAYKQAMSFYTRNSRNIDKSMKEAVPMKVHAGPALDILSVDSSSDTVIPYRKGGLRLNGRDLYVPSLDRYVSKSDKLVVKRVNSNDMSSDIYMLQMGEELVSLTDITISEFRDVAVTEYKYIDVSFKNVDRNMFMKLKLQLANKKLRVASKDVPRCKAILEDIDDGTVTTKLLRKFSIMTGIELSVIADSTKQMEV